MAADDLTPYERARIQMEYAVPLLRDLQTLLGHEAVLDALRTRLEQRIERAKAGARTDVPASRRLAAAADGFAHFGAEGALKYEVIASDSPNRIGVDVTSCGYARMMDGLDARDLGHLLLCSEDHVLVAAAGTKLERTMTCMQGHGRCDFRFSVADD